VGCGGGGWATSPDKNHFCPQDDKSACILTQILTGRYNTTVTKEAVGRGFYGSIAKRSLQKQCENYPKNTVRPNRGGGQSHDRPLNTPLIKSLVSRCKHNIKPKAMVKWLDFR